MDDVLSDFVTLRTYARFLWDEGRREVWPESVGRYCGWAFADPRIPEKVKKKSKEKILAKETMPSMRALWTAGKAADQDNTVIYNCSALTIDSISSFSEILLILMCGAGVGFSVESKFVSLLPKIAYQRNMAPYQWKVEDSRRGWKDALDYGLNAWWNGRDCYFDYSSLRPMGAPLKTMGGRSSGGDVLRYLMEFAKETVLKAQGRQLTPLECHDLCCSIASVVIVGGTRRSALISLSDLTDVEIRNCKQPGFHPRRNGANNSAVYYSRPAIDVFLDEWQQLIKSKSGERGIANIWAARKNAPHRRKSKLIQLLNPCGEVSLRNRQFCNLSEVVVRSTDDFESLRDKVTTATWLGVIQSTFTNFPDLPDSWRENCEDERLCGVSLTGQFDNPGLLTPEVLKLLKNHAVNVAKKAAKILGINTPTAVTTTKPSGTVSLVVDSSAGLHPRWSQYYLKSIQIATNDPLFALMRDQGAPIYMPKDGNGATAVLQFPVASPKGAITRHDLTAIDQLEWYKRVTENYTEHQASCTVYVAENEWLGVANWVYNNWDQINGISFFPKENGGSSYEWTPNQDLTEDEYNRLADSFPKIDFSRLPDYEKTDQTTGAKELACAGGACEL